MSTTTTTVEIRGNASSFRAEMDDATKSLGQFGRAIDVTNKEAVVAWRESAAATREIAPALKATTEQAMLLEQVIRQTEDRIDSADRKMAVASERMARGMQFVARSGDLAGRGMSTLLAGASDIAFAFGPEGAIIGAIAIASLSIVDFFNRAEKEAKKSQKAMDDWALHLIKTSDPDRMEAFATGNRSSVIDLQQQIDEKRKQLAELNAADARGGDLGTGAGVSSLQKQIDLLEIQKNEAQGRASYLDQQARQSRQELDLTLQVDKLRTDLQSQRSELLQKESELQKSNDLFATQALQAQISVLDGAAAVTERKLRDLIALNADILGLNADKERRQLDVGDRQFGDQERKITDRDPFSKATEEAKKTNDLLKGIGDLTETWVQHQPTKEEVKEQADAQRQALSGFAGETVPRWVGETLVDAFRKGLKDQDREKAKDRLKPGEQFTVPESVQKNLDTFEGYTGHDGGPFGFLKKLPDDLRVAGDSFREFADKAKQGMSDVQEAGLTLYTSLRSGTKTALDEMVRGHQVSMPLVKRALGEPIVTYLEGLAIKDAADAVSDAASGKWAKAGREAAAALEAGGAAMAAGSLFGVGGSSKGGSAGSGGSGGGASSASLGRGGGGQQTVVVQLIIDDQRPSAREAGKQLQMQQRLIDRNQPYRLVL